MIGIRFLQRCSLLFLFFPALYSFSQTAEKEVFSPYGSPFGRIFTNFHLELTGQDRQSAFAVDRAYLGYNYTMTRELSAFIKLDIGSPNDISEYSKFRRYAYFKNAGFRYHKNRLTWSFGLIDTRQLLLQEKIWAHRYIMKSYQDQYKFGPKADLGTILAWQFTSWLSADLSFLNGEGYKQLQLDNTYKSAFGITLTPGNHWIFRMYGDIMIKNTTESDVALFISRKGEKMQYGAEFNYRFNDNYIDNHDMWGTSLYGLYRVSEKFELFARYDYLTSNPAELPDAGWNFNHDGSALITGIQYQPIKSFKVAANYQDWYPWPENFDNQTFFFLNFEIDL
ncbi:MAG: porin [Chlorobi bacterium]|nr:porin [Chlorobiota bacterium]